MEIDEIIDYVQNLLASKSYLSLREELELRDMLKELQRSAISNTHDFHGINWDDGYNN